MAIRNRPGRLLPAIAMIMMQNLCGVAAQAQSLPRWELGLGLGLLSLPYYRGAAESRTYLIPFPYIQYRGEHVRVDDEGLRGYLFRSEYAKLDFSVAAGIPVPTRNVSARRGMPSLSPTVEIGPSLEIFLWHAPERTRALWLKLPLRAAFSVDWRKVAHQGWIFAPFLEYQVRKGKGAEPWLINVSAGAQFADRAYHDYFYEVAAPYVTPTRPEYHPDAGYSGSRITLTVQKRWGTYSVGAFARYDTLQGAVFADGPLVRQKYYFAYGAAVIKLLAISKKLEEIP